VTGVLDRRADDDHDVGRGEDDEQTATIESTLSTREVWEMNPTGRFKLKRITVSKRLRAKLAEVKDQLKRRRHQPIPEEGRWLASVRGHLSYYAVPGNSRALRAFRDQATRHWFKALRRRSQRHRLAWEKMNRLAARWLPPVRILHPYVRFDARTRGRSPVR
jgi:hypothetical protein